MAMLPIGYRYSKKDLTRIPEYPILESFILLLLILNRVGSFRPEFPDILVRDHQHHTDWVGLKKKKKRLRSAAETITINIRKEIIKKVSILKNHIQYLHFYINKSFQFTHISLIGLIEIQKKR